MVCVGSEDVLSSGLSLQATEESNVNAIVNASKIVKNNLNFAKNDIVRTNSTGTPITVDNVDYVLFNAENIMGIVI